MTVYGHWRCFQDDVAIPVAETSLGCKPDLICVGEPANNRGLECQFPVVQFPDTVLDGLLGVLDHRRRGRCPFPSELPGTCMFDLRLPINWTRSMMGPSAFVSSLKMAGYSHPCSCYARDS